MGNIEKGYIFEVKPSNPEGTRLVLPETITKGTQMSENWTNLSIKEIRESTNLSSTIINHANDLKYALESHILERYIITCDKKLKQVIVAKLDTY